MIAVAFYNARMCNECVSVDYFSWEELMNRLVGPESVEWNEPQSILQLDTNNKWPLWTRKCWMERASIKYLPTRHAKCLPITVVPVLDENDLKSHLGFASLPFYWSFLLQIHWMCESRETKCDRSCIIRILGSLRSHVWRFWSTKTEAVRAYRRFLWVTRHDKQTEKP